MMRYRDRRFRPGRLRSIELWPADAVVVYEWLMTVDFDQIPVGHQAQKQALAELLTALETKVPVAGITQAQIEQAQNEVSKDMDWL
jgi:hypothetical protein